MIPSWEKTSSKKKKSGGGRVNSSGRVSSVARGSVKRSLSPSPKDKESTAAVLNYFHNATVQGAHYSSFTGK